MEIIRFRHLSFSIRFIYVESAINICFISLFGDFATKVSRYCIRMCFLGFSMIGVLFDVAVCYLGKNLDLYGAQENDRRREFIKEDDMPQTADGEKKKKKEMNGNVN